VAQLCALHRVDLRHAKHVAEGTATLFNITAPIHELDMRFRDTAFYAGYLHNVAYAAGRKRHEKCGRNILLHQPLADLTDEDRSIVAVTTAFHRKSWKRARLTEEPSLLVLAEPLREAAVMLAALVRMADGLDYSHSHATSIASHEQTKDRLRVWLKGPFADSDASRAMMKADMWHDLVGAKIDFRTGPP
jgi:exopolyphosphatase/pppGpp-phosphohydrolase